MTRLLRFLGTVDSSTVTTISTTQQQPATLDSDFVVILAALLCALICVLGLVTVARCTWLRRLSSRAETASGDASMQPPVPSAAKRGLKKKVIKSLPKQTLSAESKPKSSDCAICLAEFVSGDEIRVLPQCGHGFHVNCIDTWLVSHSSCPSCRHILVVSRCKKCGGLPASCSSRAEIEAQMKERQDDTNRFLP